MKTTILTLTLMAWAFITNATIIYVDNNSNSPSVYDNIQDAVDNANDQDTIYVVGSTTQYNGATINDKALHFIGSGFGPNKQNALPTQIFSLNFTILGSGGISASGSSVEGCQLQTLTTSGAGNLGGTDIEDIVIKRNLITTQLRLWSNSTNILVTNNIIDGAISLGNSSTDVGINNIIISNNILSTIFWSVTGSNGNGSHLITNNLFLAGAGNCLTQPSQAVITNNIFVGGGLVSPDGAQTVYNNNIIYCQDNTLPTGGTGNTFSGNLIGVDPNFVNAPGINVQGLYTYDALHDYNLGAGSQGIGAGTDGTDIGIYGGSSYIWPEGGASGSGFMYQQEANIPQVNQMNILNSTVPQNGMLNVDVTGIINP